MNTNAIIDQFSPLIYRVSHTVSKHPKVLDDNAVSTDDVIQQCFTEALDVIRYYREGGVSLKLWLQVNLEQRMSKWARSLGTVSTAPIYDESDIDEEDKEPLYEDDPTIRMDAARILSLLPKSHAETLRMMFGIDLESPLSLEGISKVRGISVSEARRFTFHTINMARALSEGRLS